jgi:hypothetical protein
VACVLAIGTSFAVLYRFQQRLLQMRAGKDPYKEMLEVTPLTSFSDSSTPSLGGMVRYPLQPPRHFYRVSLRLLLSTLKQARAVGIGIALATALSTNPVDAAR